MPSVLLRGALVAVALALVAGCAGGSTSSMTPSTVISPDSMHDNLQATSAPTDRIKAIDAAKERDDLLGGWTFEEPLEVASGDTLALPRLVKSCSPLSPLFGYWYLSLKDFTVPNQTVTVPACTATSKAKVVDPSTFYIVEIDVSLSGVAVTGISSPPVVVGDTWQFSGNAKVFSFSADHIYAFWVAQYTGTGTPN